VAEVVDSVLAIIRPRAIAGALDIRSEVASGLVVRADRDRLAQIVLNLVDNAVKNTPPGGRVGVAARRPDAGMIEVTVADTGTGIPAADVPRLTERFYRVDRARSREQGGSGLGLAIVKHLVLAHGGELTVESEPGKGTTVRFTLPPALAANPSTPSPA
jgi:two-component system phosphate regulon sensor histidine kinase PhoR